MTHELSPQRSTLEGLVAENERTRDSLNEVRKQKEEIYRTLKKVQAENKAYQLRLKTIEIERQKDLSDNRRFIQNLDQEKKEKVRLLTELAEIKNLMARKDAELASVKSSSNNLEKENERLSKLCETWNIEKVNTIRQKQNATNSVRLLQTKLQASEMENKFQTNKAAQLESELVRVKEELLEISKKYHEKELGVQAIYKDEEVTKGRLLEEFQNKISDKDYEMKKELQKYLNENSKLKQQIIQLRGAAH